MADERPLTDDIEKETGSIPAPVVSSLPFRSRRVLPRPKVILACFAIVALIHYLGCWVCQINKDISAQEGFWITNGFSQDFRILQRVPPHRAPFGKLAEAAFLAVPNPASAILASRQYATKPHLAGSPGDYQTAKDFLELLQTELGIDTPGAEPVFPAGSAESREATLSITKRKHPTAWIDVYYPVMNTPLDRSLQILDDDGKPVWTAELEEVADETDPEAGKYKDAVPTFHGYSKGGEAKGKLVYAHYGRREDYEALVEMGVDLKGSIVLTRYGGIFRGLKVKGAQELGAAACLIYSDPRDDGTVTQENGYDAYPNGPARNPSSVQRGSTQFLSIYPGDPTTPGYPSYENSTREDGTNIPSIPSLPISWANAKVLLEEIKEGGPHRNISLVNHVDDRVIPIWNTMGVIPGHISQEVVVIGNHRDAWVMGATDPSSGTASIHEVIRGLGVLLKEGWKPLRTIVIASWDAEEYGLIGSTEWGEDFADWIHEHVATYLNLDSSVSGSRFEVSGSPSLAHFLRAAAEDVAHPTKLGLTLWDATKDKGPLYGDHLDEDAVKLYEQVEEQRAEDEIGVGVLGSGSDFTVFLQRIGVASANSDFKSTLSDPVYHYHSVFDSERWQELYADPGFLRHVAMAKYLGLQTLRLADAIVLPVNTTHYAVQLGVYLDHVEELAATSSIDVDFAPLRESIEALHAASALLDEEKIEAERELKRVARQIARRHYIKHKLHKAWCKLRKLLGRPCHKHHDDDDDDDDDGDNNGRLLRPRVGRAPAWLREQREKREREQAEIAKHACYVKEPKDKKDKELKKRLKKAIKRVKKVNKKLTQFERGFIHPDGIKDREWYRHLGVAPGKWLGYGATTLPALTEAITFEANATLAQYEVERLKGLIDHLTHKIRVKS
ncbi:Zn-dependent exopeptidase [Laetiporus sulphureus 93-53]|uniref:Zn-dependent exopeptidase n=1 Tax=Laetiporus sulphureus 93-53 TaxID=1314785 RepID=A0A165I8K7_9APHY|nr:Zn-dependent exopeptidase [Laetiporus sulphureus 93-53]KZT12731.1 Zn-dependent exopeptidase [Laetiporus sulphureus 93-53]